MEMNCLSVFVWMMTPDRLLQMLEITFALLGGAYFLIPIMTLMTMSFPSWSMASMLKQSSSGKTHHKQGLGIQVTVQKSYSTLFQQFLLSFRHWMKGTYESLKFVMIQMPLSAPVALISAPTLGSVEAWIIF